MLKFALKHSMRGGYCEFEDNHKVRFIEVYAIEYNEGALHRLKKIDCLEDSILGEYLSLIKEHIPPDTRFLYKLETYYGRKEFKDQREFFEDLSDYEMYGFHHIDDLLKFCKEKWGITENDFKPIYETSIPH